MPVVPGQPVKSDAEWLSEGDKAPSQVGPAPSLSKPKPVLQSDADWLAEGEQEEVGRLGFSVQHGIKQSPDQAARVLKLQMRTGLAPDLIKSNLDQIEVDAKASGFDPVKYRESSPVVAKWLAENPNHPSIAAEDLSRLNYIERQFRYIGEQYGKGKRTVELGKIGESAWFGSATPEQRKRQAELEKDLARETDYGIDGFFETIPGAIANQIPIFGKSIAGKVKGAAVGGAGGAAIGAGTALVAGQLGPQVATPEEVVTVPAAAAAMGSKGAFWGWRYGAAVEAARLEGGLAYLEFEKLKDEQGAVLDKDTARGAAAIVGAVNGSLEMIGLQAVLKNVPGIRAIGKDGIKKILINPTTRGAFMTYAKNVGKAMAGEGATEALQELVKNFGGILAKSYQDGSLPTMSGEALLEQLSAATQAGIEGAKAGGGMSAVTGVTAVATDVAKAKKAEANKEIFVNIGQGIAESKVLERAPEKMQELATRLTESGPTKTLYVPVEAWTTYWQSKKDDAGNPIDPGAVAEEILGSRDAYEESLQTGGDIAIPTDRYAMTIAPSEHNAFFADEIRVDPREMNAREAKAYFEKLDADEAAQAEKVEEAKADPAVEVGTQVSEQLRAAGFDEKTTSSYSKIWESAFRSLGERTGVDPKELFDRFSVKIRQGGDAPQFAEVPSAAAQGQVFEQRDGEGPRGRILFGNGQATIEFFKTADKSTFLHETGHFYLEVMGSISTAENVPQQLKDDYAQVLSWLGVESKEQITAEHHEKWARGFEAYLMEGKAPTSTLRKAFADFKRWLTRIYKSIAQLNVELSPEIRGVMGRLLATEQEIEQARAEQNVEPLFVDPEAAGMNPDLAKKYMAAREEARLAAVEHFSGKIMSEWKREEESWWKEQLEKIKTEVAEEVNAQPIYRALSVMRTGKLPDGTPSPAGKVKLSKQAIVDQFGEARLEKLKGLYAVKDGKHHDAVAEGFGFTSGDEFISALETAEDKDVLIERIANERMKEIHGEMISDPQAMKEEAIAAVYNDKYAQLLRYELQHLASNNLSVLKDVTRRIARRVPPDMETREWARAQVASKKVKDIRPHVFQRAAARAAKEAGEFWGKGDIDAAFDAKLREARNVELYREALAAKEKIEKIEDYAKAAQKTTRRQRLGKINQEWLGQFETILARFGFRPTATETKQGLSEWLESVKKEEGEEIAIAPVVMSENSSAPYAELSFEDLVGVYDTLRSIEHVARKLTEVEREGQILERKEAERLLVESVHKALPNEKPLPETEKVYGEAHKVWEMTKGFMASNLRPEKIFERLDGGTKGIFHDLFWNKSVDAQVRRDDLRIKVMDPLKEFTANMPKAREKRMNERVFIKSLNRSLHRRTLIGVALNVGNASNKAKLMEGGMWFGETHVELDQTSLDELLGQLDEQDWQMVQKIWDSIDVLYPELNELNKRAVGLPLERIEAQAVSTKFGEMRGGYWPAVGDPRHSKVGEKQENTDSMVTDVFGPKYKKAATLSSARKERTAAAYPLQLDWQRVLANHVDKAITDIAYHEWIKQARRLIEATAVKKAIQNRMGEQVYRGLEEWLVHQVQTIHGGYSANNDIESIQSTLISNTAVAALGFNVATAIGNSVVAPIQASHQVRPDYIIRGIVKYLSSPRKAMESVAALSGEMKHRAMNLDQTYGQVMKRLEGKDTYKAKLAFYAMAIHGAVDRPMSTALWLGKYQQEIDKGSTPNEAMRAADKMIRTTQTAGAAKDLSSFERDPRYRMFKMFLGPMIIMQNEMRGAVAGKGAKALVDPKVWSTMMATWIIPAVLFELAVGRGPDLEDEDEAMDWALRKILLYPAMTVPYVRDAASVIEQALSGKKASTRSNPITDVLTGLWKAADRLFDEDATTGTKVEVAARAAGPVLGIPTNQAIKAVKLFEDSE